MKWHCGLLSPDPWQDTTFRYIVQTANWWNLPPDILEEVEIWTSMPGFTYCYHLNSLREQPRWLNALYGKNYDKHKAKIAENWLSVTREDCIALTHLRPPGRGNVPVLAQLQALKDYRSGHRFADVVRDYGCTNKWLARLIKTGIKAKRGFRPAGFELLDTDN